MELEQEIKIDKLKRISNYISITIEKVRQDLEKIDKIMKLLITETMEKEESTPGKTPYSNYSEKFESLLEEITEKMIEELTKKILESYNIENIKITIPISFYKQFDFTNFFSFLKTNYIDNASKLANSFILESARGLLAVDTSSNDLHEGAKVFLHVKIENNELSMESRENLENFERLLNVLFRGTRPERAKIHSYGFSREITVGFQNKEDKRERRNYYIQDNVIDSIEISGNGKMIVTFEKDEYAEKVVKVLLNRS